MEGPKQLKLYAKLPNVWIINDPLYNESCSKLIRELNSLIFYMEMEDQVILEKRVPIIRNLYLTVLQGIRMYGLEHQENWAKIALAMQIVEENCEKMKQ